MNISRRDSLVSGAVNGVEVWGWYAAVEYLFSTAAPMLFHPEKVFSETRWRGTVILFACYAVCGLVTGLLAGLMMDRSRNLPQEEFDRRNRKALIVVLVAAFGINLVLLPAQAGRLAAFLGVSLAAAAVIFDARQSGFNLGFSASPGVVAGILAFTARLAFVSFRNLSAAMTIIVTPTATLAALAVAALAIRLARRVRFSNVWNPMVEHGAIIAAAMGLIFGPGAVSSIKAALATPPARPSAPGTLPNIILITLDTVRADHLGIYGYDRQNTPNLKNLLKESSLYTNFVSASTLTLTSHASMFTGLYPKSHGAFKQFPNYPFGQPLPGEIPTVASILGSAGYRSAALAANLWYLGPQWGLLRSFDYAWTPTPLPLIEDNHSYFLRGRVRDLFHSQPVTGDDEGQPTVDADAINREANKLLDRFSGRQTPFLLFLNYMDAHWPYHAPPPYDSAYPGRDQWYSGNDAEAAMRTSVDCGGQPVDAGYRAHILSQYDGAIAYLDSKIGELIDHLKQDGLFDRSMIIITSDHGEALGDRGYLGHNVSVYQDQVHVPLIIKYPGNRGPERVDGLASHVDLLPTILEVAGVAPKPGLPGVSLLRLGSQPDRAVFSERHYGPCLDRNARVPGIQYALFQGSSKMISSSLGVSELYNLKNDPREKTDLYPTDPSPALQTALRDWMRTTPHVRTARETLDPEELKRLRSLGYLGQ